MAKRFRTRLEYNNRVMSFSFGPIDRNDPRIPQMYEWCETNLCRNNGDWIYYLPYGRRGVRSFAFKDEETLTQFKISCM